MSENIKVNGNVPQGKKVTARVNNNPITTTNRTTKTGTRPLVKENNIPVAINKGVSSNRSASSSSNPQYAELARKADEEAKRNYLKTKRKRFIRASIVCMMGFAMLLSGGIYSYNQRKDYSSWPQIEEISNALNCDMSYMEMVNKRAIKTFQHNGNEPIYVSLPKDAPDHIKESITLSLDYMFGVMEQINPNYRYKIVSDSELNNYKTKGKSTIEFKRSEEKLPTSMAADAMIKADNDLTSILTFGKMVDNYTITYDAEKLEKKTPSVESGCDVFLHELLHVFSFSDVYDKDAVYANTYIHPSVGDKYDAFFPNDLKCLISSYAPKFKSKAEQSAYIEKMKKFVSDYETTFYKDIIAEEKRQTTANLEEENISLLLKDTVTSNKKTYDYYYRIEIQNGKYTFEILDNEKNVLDKTSGEAVLVDGVFVLKDAFLKYGLSSNLERIRQGGFSMYDDGLYTDLRVYKYKKYLKDEDYSCLLATNFTLPEHCEVESSKGFYTEAEIQAKANRENETQAQR